jgi:putative nucleotidyltransferase with HDIG domain
MTLPTSSEPARVDAKRVQEFRAEVIARKNLPTIPTVLARIIALTEAEAASGKELVEVVEHDQALTSKILRLANSAFFGQSRRVATIPRAVMLLGFSTVRNLALSVKVWEALGNGVDRTHLETLWSHAVMGAVATRALTAKLRAADPDEAFTAGVLHDVGRLVIALRFGEQYWATVGGADEGGAVEVLEAGTFGVDHAEVGGWMLEAWNFPPAIVEAIRHHHTGLERQGLTGMLAAADRLVGCTDLATGALRPEAEALLATLAPRGITAERWAAVTSELQASRALAGDGV